MFPPSRFHENCRLPAWPRDSENSLRARHSHQTNFRIATPAKLCLDEGRPEGGRDAATQEAGERSRGGGAAMSFAPFRIESAALSHVGRVRDTNQDSFCIRERDGLWAVADGMGG